VPSLAPRGIVDEEAPLISECIPTVETGHAVPKDLEYEDPREEANIEKSAYDTILVAKAEASESAYDTSLDSVQDRPEEAKPVVYEALEESFSNGVAGATGDDRPITDLTVEFIPKILVDNLEVGHTAEVLSRADGQVGTQREDKVGYEECLETAAKSAYEDLVTGSEGPLCYIEEKPERDTPYDIEAELLGELHPKESHNEARPSQDYEKNPSSDEGRTKRTDRDMEGALENKSHHSAYENLKTAETTMVYDDLQVVPKKESRESVLVYEDLELGFRRGRRHSQKEIRGIKREREGSFVYETAEANEKAASWREPQDRGKSREGSTQRVTAHSSREELTKRSNFSQDSSPKKEGLDANSLRDRESNVEPTEPPEKGLENLNLDGLICLVYEPILVTLPPTIPSLLIFASPKCNTMVAEAALLNLRLLLLDLFNLWTGAIIQHACHESMESEYESMFTTAAEKYLEMLKVYPEGINAMYQRAEALKEKAKGSLEVFQPVATGQKF
jgi:hypothetical protein